MKKKILFIMPSMFIGGAERSLLGIFENIDYDKTDVSLFLYRHEGEFLKYIPEEVHLLPEIREYRTFDVPIVSLLKSELFLYGIARILSKVSLWFHCKMSGEKRGVWMSMQYTSKFLQPLLPEIPGEYDLAIMFLGVPDTLIQKVHALRRFTWCHTVYDTLGPDKKLDLHTYAGLDGIVHVTEECRERMARFYPELRDRMRVIENILPVSLIRKQSEELVSDMKTVRGQKILLSIGRFSQAKNFDNIPDICSRIVGFGMDIKWYIIGYGSDEELIRKEIRLHKMQERVIVLGKRENPYPYIRRCDLYVQPSRWEGKCVTVREAQSLGKPVVITRYLTAEEQLKNGVDGIIVPVDNAGCALAIETLLKNSDRMDSLSKACLKGDYTNREAIACIYELL